MNIATILRPEAIRVMGSVTSKRDLLHNLAELAQRGSALATSIAVDALLARELLSSTAVGKGVALPHARLPDIDQVQGMFILLDKPVDFDAADGHPVDLVFGLFAPEDDGVAHLKALAVVSRRLRDTAVCATLRANRNPETLHAILVGN